MSRDDLLITYYRDELLAAGSAADGHALANILLNDSIAV